jgi:5-methylcytosine-specific restriction endonuclease McrA
MNCHKLTIADLRDKYKNNQIQLDPPYQRKPVWKTKQRSLLLTSLFNGIPIPALIFNKQFDTKRKKDVYDVLDGKQRVETILHFIEEFQIKDEQKLLVEFINRDGKRDSLSFNDLKLKRVNKEYANILEKFWSYPLPIIEYEGDLTDFFERNVASKEVFVRINSTGSPLKANEIRHARYSSHFFDLGSELEKRYKILFSEKWKIISKTDIDRYIFHEYLMELCTAIHLNGYSDRRKKLDELLSNYQWTKAEIAVINKKFRKIIDWLKDIFPGDIFRTTRFKNKSDFYSLFIVLLNLVNKGYVTKDRKSNRVAGKILSEFSKQVQMIDPQIKAYNLPTLSHNEKQLSQYIVSTRQATDSNHHREIRHDFLMSVLKDGIILKKKDSRRAFDENVKGLLWNELLVKSRKPKCPNPLNNPKCKKYLTFEDAQVDHIHPWSKGGKTSFENARLICSSCNSSKGAK